MKLLLLISVLFVVGCNHTTDLSSGSDLKLDTSNKGVADAGKMIVDGISDFGSAAVEATADNLIEIGSAAKGPLGLAAVLGGLYLTWRKRRN